MERLRKIAKWNVIKLHNSLLISQTSNDQQLAGIPIIL